MASKKRRTVRNRAKQLDPFAAPAEVARLASLRYVNDTQPGIRRVRAGSGFAYKDAAGASIRDSDTLKRIRALVIPPAWSNVWICPLAEGHLQATGRDARGRKQYRYHTRWREVRDETKYTRMLLFGRALPQIRARVRADLNRPGLPREKVLAMVVALLEATFIRVGNEEYARQNNSYGLTTLKDRHVEIDGSRLRFGFRGKSGKVHSIELADRRMARLVKQCRDVPGQDLFQYIDDDGNHHPITSADVNEYLREISQDEFTAKDFRTWAGTLLTGAQLSAAESFDDLAVKKAQIAAIEAVAGRLGNTVAVCRKCYIHPLLLNAFQNRDVYALWRSIAEGKQRAIEGLEANESALLTFIERATEKLAEFGLSA